MLCAMHGSALCGHGHECDGRGRHMHAAKLEAAQQSPALAGKLAKTLKRACRLCKCSALRIFLSVAPSADSGLLTGATGA